MNCFNLIDEPWIPVRFLDGRRLELGVRETLQRASEIAGIEDASPLVTVAVHRFLLAVLYRALEGPTDIDQAVQLFANGPSWERVSQYLDQWHHRFALLDDELPFWQIAAFEPKTWRAWTVLATEHNADNAKVLFDHVDVSNAGTVSYAAAARWLIATQTFAVSSGKSELAHTGTAPSATAALILPIGQNLQDTLLFSLVPQNRDVLASDLPVWERQPECVEALRSGAARTVDGLCDLYTWRSRSVRLDSRNASGVARVAFASGVAVSPSEPIDPMVAHRIDEKNGRLPVQLRDRGLWRDFDSLLPDDEHSLVPRVIDHTVALTRLFRQRMPIAIAAAGQANDKAKIEFWRLERFSFPPALASNVQLRYEVKDLLQEAENAQRSLWTACRDFARDLLSRGREREPAKQDVTRFVQQMVSIPFYWSALETRFHRLLPELGQRHPDDVRGEWLCAVRDVLREAWDQHRQSLSLRDAWTLRALATAESPLRRKLAELGQEIQELKPQEDAV